MCLKLLKFEKKSTAISLKLLKILTYNCYKQLLLKTISNYKLVFDC